MRLLLAVALACLCATAYARENEAWERVTPEIRAWYGRLMQPDNPAISCCGEADAYHADSFEECPKGMDQDVCSYVAIITDERPPCDGTAERVEQGCVSGRPHIPAGTRVMVPKRKLKYDQGNPTGHGILFLVPDFSTPDGSIGGYKVYCYVVPGGA